MEDKNGKIRVKIQKYPISNIGMDILNKEMDCCDALAPNYRYVLYLIRKLPNKRTKGIQ